MVNFLKAPFLYLLTLTFCLCACVCLCICLHLLFLLQISLWFARKCFFVGKLNKEIFPGEEIKKQQQPTKNPNYYNFHWTHECYNKIFRVDYQKICNQCEVIIANVDFIVSFDVRFDWSGSAGWWMWMWKTNLLSIG